MFCQSLRCCPNQWSITEAALQPLDSELECTEDQPLQGAFRFVLWSSLVCQEATLVSSIVTFDKIARLCAFETTGRRIPWEDPLWGPGSEMVWFLATFLILSLIVSSLFFPVMASSVYERCQTQFALWGPAAASAFGALTYPVYLSLSLNATLLRMLPFSCHLNQLSIFLLLLSLSSSLFSSRTSVYLDVFSNFSSIYMFICFYVWFCPLADVGPPQILVVNI